MHSGLFRGICFGQRGVTEHSTGGSVKGACALGLLSCCDWTPRTTQPAAGRRRSHGEELRFFVSWQEVVLTSQLPPGPLTHHRPRRELSRHQASWQEAGTSCAGSEVCGWEPPQAGERVEIQVLGTSCHPQPHRTASCMKAGAPSSPSGRWCLQQPPAPCRPSY